MPAFNITNKLVSSYLDTLYRGRSPELEDLRAFAEEAHVPVITRDAEQLLGTILKMRKPSAILEIGTAIGYSACVFASCCDAQITTVESDSETYESAINNIEALGFRDRITPLLGDGAEVLRGLSKGTGSVPEEGFDVVFIDAAKSHYREFWELALPLLSDDAVIICDNVLQKGMTANDVFDTRGRYKTSIRRMREFLNFINDLDYADTSVLPVGDGVSLSIIEKQDRD